MLNRRALTQGKQLTAATLPTANTPSNPWANDTHGQIATVERVVIQSDYGNAAGSFIEYGGPDVTHGNGLQLAPGDSAELAVPNAASIWAIPSGNGLVLRGQVQ